MWEFLKRLFGLKPRPPTVRDWTAGWHHGEKPPNMTFQKQPKPPSGWVNLHVRREMMDLLGETSVKKGLAPAAIVNALFKMFASWTEEEKLTFVWQYLLEGTPTDPEDRNQIAQTLYLSASGLTPEEPPAEPKVVTKKAEPKAEPEPEMKTVNSPTDLVDQAFQQFFGGHRLP